MPVLWHAVPPNSRGHVSGVNRMIRRVCAERPDCTYIETRFDRRDFLDGVHLTLTGYSHWIASLQEAVGRIDRKRSVPAGATPAPYDLDMGNARKAAWARRKAKELREMASAMPTVVGADWRGVVAKTAAQRRLLNRAAGLDRLARSFEPAEDEKLPF